MVRATDSVTLQTLKDIKTIEFDENDGLVIASEDGNTKIVINDTAIELYQSGNRVAKYAGNSINLGEGFTNAVINFLNNACVLGRVGDQAFLSGKSISIASSYSDGDDDESAISSLQAFSQDLESHSGVDCEVDKVHNLKRSYVRIYGDKVYLEPFADSIIIGGFSGQSLEDYVAEHGGGKTNEWTLIKGSTTEEVISGLEDAGYSEFLLTCQLDPKGSTGQTSGRVMASIVIPADAFFHYTTDHGDGAHQAFYNSGFNAGVSYLGNNRVKMYHTSSTAYAVHARLYAR